MAKDNKKLVQAITSQEENFAGEDFAAADLAGRLRQEVKLAFTVWTDQRAAR